MTESSHNLTGVKTILSVRAQRQHLFVLDKMTLTLILILFGTRSISTTPPTVRCSVPPPLTTVYNNFITKSPLVSLLSFLFVLTRSGRMEILMICNLCPRHCGVERPHGYCGMGERALVVRTALHHWEEPCISGERGSGGGQGGNPPDGNPPDGQPGGSGGSSEVTQGDSANTITEDASVSNVSYSSTGDDENALRIDGATVTLDGIRVDKSAGATSNTENGDFYGVNAALLATNGATVTIKNAEITSSAQNGNGVFSYGNGSLQLQLQII